MHTGSASHARLVRGAAAAPQVVARRFEDPATRSRQVRVHRRGSANGQVSGAIGARCPWGITQPRAPSGMHRHVETLLLAAAAAANSFAFRVMQIIISNITIDLPIQVGASAAADCDYRQWQPRRAHARHRRLPRASHARVRGGRGHKTRPSSLSAGSNHHPSRAPPFCWDVCNLNNSDCRPASAFLASYDAGLLSEGAACDRPRSASPSPPVDGATQRRPPYSTPMGATLGRPTYCESTLLLSLRRQRRPVARRPSTLSSLTVALKARGLS